MNRLASVVFKDENTERYPGQGRTMNLLAVILPDFFDYLFGSFPSSALAL